MQNSTARSQAPPSTGGLLSKLDIASVRVSSRQRNNGTLGRFTIMTSQILTRAVGFYVHSVALPNSWYNVNAQNNVSYWSIDGGPPVAITVAPGYYNSLVSLSSGNGVQDFGNALAQQISLALDPAVGSYPTSGPFVRDALGATTFVFGPLLGKITIAAQAVTNTYQVYVENTNHVLDFWIAGTGPGTSNAILGFTQNHTTGNQTVSGMDPFGTMVSDVQATFGEPVFVGIASPQLRRKVSLDGSGGTVANDCFHHQPVTAPKGVPMIFFNQAPTELSVIKFGGETTIQQLEFHVMNPDAATHRDLHLLQDWEIVLHFLIAPF